MQLEYCNNYFVKMVFKSWTGTFCEQRPVVCMAISMMESVINFLTCVGRRDCLCYRLLGFR